MNRKERRANKSTVYKRILETAKSRPCGECTLCCELWHIEEFDKPEGQKCKYQGESGCNRYELRPEVCRGFYCLWKIGVLHADQRPDKIGMAAQVTKELDFTFVQVMAFELPTIVNAAAGLRALAIAAEMPVVARTPENPTYFAFGSDEQIRAVGAHQQRMDKRRLKVLE